MAALTTPTAASVLPSVQAGITTGIAGASIVIGTPIYVDTANGNVIKPANADSLGSILASTVTGLALNSCAINQKVLYCVADPLYGHGFTLSEIAPGDIVLLNDTAGAFTVTPGDLDAGDWVCIIGQINNPETTMTLSPRFPILKG